VKTFIQPTPILRAMGPDLRYTIVDGFRPPSPSVDEVDYVITTLHGEIRRTSRHGLRGGGSIFEYPYDRDTLTRDFEPVFRVERPFGLEFATVWRRKGAAPFAVAPERRVGKLDRRGRDIDQIELLGQRLRPRRARRRGRPRGAVLAGMHA
jgi:hypothetical protein